MYFMLLQTLKKSVFFFPVYSATMNELICLMSAALRASFSTEKETKLFSKVLFTAYFT